MKKTSRELNMEGRIINVSSEVHRFAEGISFDKISENIKDDSVSVIVVQLLCSTV
jgi:hypothetical protein